MPSALEIDTEEIIRMGSDVLIAVIGRIAPYGTAAGMLAGFLRDLLWPRGNVDVWDEICGRVEKLIDEKIEGYHVEVVRGKLNDLHTVFKGYTEVVKKSPDNYEAIRRNWTAVITQVRGSRSQFQFTRFQVPLLPLLARFVDVHISLLRDAFLHGAKWGLDKTEIQQVKDEMRDTIGTGGGDQNYIKWVKDKYEEGRKARWGKKSHWEIMDYERTMTVYATQFAWDIWPYLDLNRYPDKLTVERKREVWRGPHGHVSGLGKDQYAPRECPNKRLTALTLEWNKAPDRNYNTGLRRACDEFTDVTHCWGLESKDVKSNLKVTEDHPFKSIVVGYDTEDRRSDGYVGRLEVKTADGPSIVGGKRVDELGKAKWDYFGIKGWDVSGVYLEQGEHYWTKGAKTCVVGFRPSKWKAPTRKAVPGRAYAILSRDDGMAIDLGGLRAELGQQLTQWSHPLPGVSHQWVVEDDAGGLLVLRNRWSGTFLGVENNATPPRLVQSAYPTAWRLDETDDGSLLLVTSLEDRDWYVAKPEDAEDGTPLLLRDHLDETSRQQWLLSEAGVCEYGSFTDDDPVVTFEATSTEREANSFTATVTLTAGQRVAPHWNLSFTLPDTIGPDLTISGQDSGGTSLASVTAGKRGLCVTVRGEQGLDPGETVTFVLSGMPRDVSRGMQDILVKPDHCTLDGFGAALRTGCARPQSQPHPNVEMR
ncbi:insecticidal delta-endotoxin Cry8Ea1 family protein [Streptoalloteichus hindustanus]|uniref:insecticidal delta-endotoxin Cry8Ea1 family protein n=1 Tax=Streptoalloteichus hindustanus TaxID=2017 RepID=UPI0013566F9A|nr:insecticidal delta-endotoxin Cry8Ea1 family protein [Streptoalloteichus hindustanus]